MAPKKICHQCYKCESTLRTVNSTGKSEGLSSVIKALCAQLYKRLIRVLYSLKLKDMSGVWACVLQRHTVKYHWNKKDDFDQVWSKQVPKTHHKVSSANKNRSLNQGRDGVTKNTVLVCHFCNWTPDDIFKAQQNSSIIYPSRTLTRNKTFNNSFTSTNCKTKSQLRDKNDSHFLNTEVKGLHFRAAFKQRQIYT